MAGVILGVFKSVDDTSASDCGSDVDIFISAVTGSLVDNVRSASGNKPHQLTTLCLLILHPI